MAVVQIMGADLQGLGGFWDSVTDTISKAGDWFSNNSGKVVQAMDAVGRLKQDTKAQAMAVDYAYQRNILNTPPRSWFEESTIFPGFSNGAVVGGAAALAVAVLLLARKPAPVRVAA